MPSFLLSLILVIVPLTAIVGTQFELAITFYLVLCTDVMGNQIFLISFWVPMCNSFYDRCNMLRISYIMKRERKWNDVDVDLSLN